MDTHTHAREKGLIVVLQITGAEECAVTATEDLGTLIVRHIKAVRRIPGLAGAVAVVCFESNSIMLAESCRRAIERDGVHRVCFMKEDGKKARGGGGASEMIELRAGIRTFNKTKEHGMYALRELLQARGVKMHASFVRLANPAHWLDESGDSRTNVITELGNMRAIYVPPSGKNAAYLRGHMLFTGRGDGGERARDDYVMALTFVVLLREVYLSSPAYSRFRAGG